VPSTSKSARQISNLTRHFLIAMPGMTDPNFANTLTFICEHNEKGALGIVVNRPTQVTMGELFEQVDIPLTDAALAAKHVFFGGPVQNDRGFVLHRPLGSWKSTLNVDAYIGLTTSKDILLSMAENECEGDQLVALGYSGWQPGQLEEEIKANGWLAVDVDSDIIFSLPPEARLNAAMARLGVSYLTLSDAAGHA
jgi:putative transcriptional regulator